MQIPPQFYQQKQEQLPHCEEEFYTLEGSQQLLAYNKQFFPFTYEYCMNIIIEQQLPKKTRNPIWNARFFTLTPSRLLYYNDSGKSILKGCFNFFSLLSYNLAFQFSYPEIRMKVKDSQSLQYKYILQLKFLQSTSFQKWKKQLQEIIKRITSISKEPACQNLISRFPTLGNFDFRDSSEQLQRNFWNKLSISLAEFESYCGHLDILLFRKKNSVSYLHRFFMRSYYDHVALVVRDQQGHILLLEAIESRGVWLIDLKTLITYAKEQYEQVAFRKLTLNQSVQLNLPYLQKYINCVVGKKYELSLNKLMHFDDTLYSESNGDQDKITCKKTFFCSELVADIYIKLGLLTGNSSQFWPKDFQSNLQLKQGANLSSKMIIQF